MKKLAYIMLAVAAFCVVSASAEMDNKKFTGTPLGATAITNSYVLRGTIEGVAIDLTAPATNTVTITDNTVRRCLAKPTLPPMRTTGLFSRSTPMLRLRLRLSAARMTPRM